MAITNKVATIPSGQSLSDIVDIGGYRIAAIIMPAAWTAAALTFRQVSPLDGAEKNVNNAANAELSVTVTVDRTHTFASTHELASLSQIRVRSGTSGTPVNQAAERKLVLILKS